MHLLAKVERTLFATKRPQFLLLLAGIELIKCGIGTIPNMTASVQIAQNPFTNPIVSPDAQYLFWNWLGPFVAWCIGATHWGSFFALHLLFSVAFTVLVARLVFTRLPDEQARTALVLFAVLPVATTAYFWVGTDSMTLFLLALALSFPTLPLVALLVGVALGMQHFEQAFSATGAFTLAKLLERKYGESSSYALKFRFALLSGVILGKLLLLAIFQHFAIVVNSGRVFWLKAHYLNPVQQLAGHFQVVLWAALGLGWLAVWKYAEMGVRARAFLVSLGALLLLLPLVLDQSRVFAVVTFPLLAAYWLLDRDFLKTVSKPMVSMLFILWLMMPWSWAWAGAAQESAFSANVAAVAHRVLGTSPASVEPGATR